VTLRNSVVPAALALAGCLPTESEPPPSLQQMTYETFQEGGVCEVEHVTYHLYADLVRAQSADKSRQTTGTLLVTVAEGTSVVACTEDVVRVASPGAELKTTAYDGNADSFSLDVPGVIIGGQRPSIWVRALIDANDNGSCDEGELVGAVELEAGEAGELGDIAIELSQDGCPTRI